MMSPAYAPIVVGKRPLRFGKFAVMARIASGGMGAVYKVFDTVAQREAALKVLTPDLAARPVMLRHFELEARHGQQLPPHEHIVTLYEAGSIHEFRYLALELIEGPDLREYVAQTGPLSVEESRTFIIQAARALGHLHEHGIIHRDIKPANFLLGHRHGRRVVKLIDFGLARHQAEPNEVEDRPPGSTLGTVDYLSPEQARNCAAADGRSDIYSLGCTWYFLLTGTAPFGEGTTTERVRRHSEAPPPDVRDVNPAVPARLARILQRMLAKNPADRYPTPTILIHELEAADKAPTLVRAPRRAAACQPF
jgi:serine/threonine-protein kinase